MMIRNQITTHMRLAEPALPDYPRRSGPIARTHGRSVLIDLMRKRRP
ncbi:MAG: hypothetical protein ACREMQ_06105 [Longimicrobiales bacterium]